MQTQAGSGSNEPKEIKRKLPGFLSELAVDIMIRYGYYSTMKMNPIDHHGYRRTEGATTDFSHWMYIPKLPNKP